MTTDIDTPHDKMTQEQQPQRGGARSPRVDECRRLVAERYLAEQYITEHDIDSETGFIDASLDPYAHHSEYFWTLDTKGEVEATIRVITHLHNGDTAWQFPMQREFELLPESQTYINSCVASSPETVIEVSGLAERKQANEFAALDMYREFWQHAKRSNYAVCLISADERLDKKLSMLFGSGIQRAGDSRFVMGSQTVPSLLFPHKCVEAMSGIYLDKKQREGEQIANSYRDIFCYLTGGLESVYFSEDEKYHIRQMGLAID